MSERQPDLTPIEKKLRVPLSVEDAFELFTHRIAEWWPLAQHSVSQASAESCVIEPRVGGRIYEKDSGGNEHTWGTVQRFDPPNALAFSWHPGRDPETAQRVAVTFESTGEGCELHLIHEGWATYGPPGTTSAPKLPNWVGLRVGTLGRASRPLTGENSDLAHTLAWDATEHNVLIAKAVVFL